MTNPTEIEQQLTREANLFAARGSAANRNRTRTYIVADFEYAYDRDRYHGYSVAEGTDAEEKIRWPFHRIAAASWCVMRFKRGSDSPAIQGPEYAAACSIPAKPSPSKTIGELVENGMWGDVEEQVLADVMTTAIIMLRHLKSHGLIRCGIPACSLALANAATTANPGSEFLRRTFKPWAQLKDSTANYTCPIYRAA